MSVLVIRGHQRSSEVIRGHLSPSAALTRKLAAAVLSIPTTRWSDPDDLTALIKELLHLNHHVPIMARLLGLMREPIREPIRDL